MLPEERVGSSSPVERARKRRRRCCLLEVLAGMVTADGHPVPFCCQSN